MISSKFQAFKKKMQVVKVPYVPQHVVWLCSNYWKLKHSSGSFASVMVDLDGWQFSFV